MLDDYRACIDALIADPAPRTFANTMLPQEALEHRSERVWSPVSHLHAVKDSDALRAVYAPAEEALSDFGAELGQNRELYAAVRAVADGAGFSALPRAARTLVEHCLRDFRLSGVALEEPARSRFRDISNALTRLATEFEEAVLDATQAWTEKVGADALAGLPETDRALMCEAAREAGHDGYLVTLKPPSVQAVLTYADDRALRERVYTAYHTRASDQGPQAGRFDNSARIGEILALRHEAARLLGFANAAEESLATKMAGDACACAGFPARPGAPREAGCDARTGGTARIRQGRARHRRFAAMGRGLCRGKTARAQIFAERGRPQAVFPVAVRPGRPVRDRRARVWRELARACRR